MNLKRVEPIVIYKVIAGSRAYGLALPTSDTDIRGVFLQSNDILLTGNQTQQVGDKKSDIVIYEFNRFVDLLSGANPNILENLFVPERCILKIDPVFRTLYDHREAFITKKIKYTFGGYAISQIKKARGLNKKIVNPVDQERKTPLDFCYLIAPLSGKMYPFYDVIKSPDSHKNYGLAKMPHGEQLYKMYEGEYGGLIGDDSNSLRHSEIPKKEKPSHFLWYNLDGYTSHCKDHKEYWEWVKNRNPHRYNDNISHNQGYDGKNLMHCLRMLDMATEAARGKGLQLERPNREWLLSVRRGEVSYSDIMELIQEKKEEMDDAFETSDLPDKLDRELVNHIIRKTRKV